MNWITRKVRNYVAPALGFLFNSSRYFFTKKKADNIIILADFTAYGGTRTYFEQVCHFLKQRNKKVTCFITQKQIDQPLLQLLKQLEFEYEIIIDEDYVIEYAGKWSIRSIASYVSKVVNKLNYFFELFIKYKSHTLFISTAEPEKWLWLFWLPLHKCVYVIHTLPHRSIGSIGNYSLHKNLDKSNLIVTVSNYAKDAICAYWKIPVIDQIFVKVIANYFEPVCEKAVLKRESNKIRVLTIGHLVSYKNPLLWIEIAKTILKKMPEKNIAFVWAGDGQLLEYCKQEVKDHQQVQFIGYRQNVDELYTSSDIYLQPSKIESQGISVIGAMHYALPCIVSNAGGLPESVINGLNGYVIDAENVEYYADKLMYLIQNNDAVITMGKEGKKIFQEKFEKSSWEKKMNELFNTNQN